MAVEVRICAYMYQTGSSNQKRGRRVYQFKASSFTAQQPRKWLDNTTNTNPDGQIAAQVRSRIRKNTLGVHTMAGQQRPQNQQEEQQPPPSAEPPPDADPATSATSPPASPPASPPLPTRHTAVTPGPRAQQLQRIFEQALTHTLAKISLDNFASCYPTIAARAPHILRQVQRGMVDRLAQLCRQEFAGVLDRRGVVAKLNELEALVSDADLRRRSSTRPAANNNNNNKGKGKGKGKEAEEAEGQAAQAGPTPPHLLPAEAVLAAHLAPHLAGQQSQMNAKLQNTQAANVALWEGIRAQRAEVEALLHALEAALADVDGAAGLLDGVPAEELARESRGLEAEMADV